MSAASVNDDAQPVMALADKAMLPNLDGLRAIACLLVVISHLSLPWHIASLGDTGVGVFFCLSGFLMAYLYGHLPWNIDAVSRYAIARFSRIAPIYWAVILLCTLLTIIDNHFILPIDSGLQFIRHMLFGGSVGVFWSISPEVQFYVFFMLLWWTLAGRGRWLGGTVILLCASLITTHSFWPGLSLPSKLHLFLAGALCGLLPRVSWNGRGRSILLVALQIAAAALLVAIVWRFHTVQAELYQHVEIGVLIAAAIYVLSFNSSWSTAIFASSPLRAIGRGSFSIYLLHQLVLDYGTRLLGLQRQFVSPWLALGAVAVALPMIVSRYVEMPLQKSARRALEHIRDRVGVRLATRPPIERVRRLWRTRTTMYQVSARKPPVA